MCVWGGAAYVGNQHGDFDSEVTLLAEIGMITLQAEYADTKGEAVLSVR